VARRNYLKVPAVKSGDLMEVQPLGKCYHASVHDLKSQRRVGSEQFGHPPVVMRRDLDDAGSSSAIAAQNSAARPTRPRRCGSASR
jgi:hypothetical protein